MSLTTDDYLSLNGVSIRSAYFRFDMLDQTGVKIDEVHPSISPTITNDTTRAVQRSLTNFELSPDQGAAFDEIHARVQPWMVLENKASAPLGTFIFVDARRIVSTYGTAFTGTMSDLGTLIDQPMTETYALPTGALIEKAIADIFVRQGIVNYSVPVTGVVTGAPIAWPAGTSWKAVQDQLCGMMGALPSFIDAAGAGTVIIAHNLALSDVDVSYESGLNIYESVAEWNNILVAPNYFEVIESGQTGSAPIVGSYALPVSAPNSEFNLSRRIAKVYNEQGLASVSAANQLAYVHSITDGAVLETVAFDGPPDWRHGTYSVLDVLGKRYVEQSWSLTCDEGANMHHQAQRVYS